MDFPGFTLTILNRTGQQLACWYPQSPDSKDTYIPAGAPAFPIGAMPNIDLAHTVIDIKPAGTPEIHVRPVKDDPNGWKVIFYKVGATSPKQLELPVPANATVSPDICIEVYADGDFWIRRPDASFKGHPAHIVFTVDTFNEIPSAAESSARLAKHDDGPTGAAVEVLDRNIKVKGETDLRFTVVSPDGSINYQPLAVVLKRIDAESGHADLTGWMAFGNYRVNKHSITLRDRFPDNKVKYKYSILVQHPDGRMGFIDPEIENNSTD